MVGGWGDDQLERKTMRRLLVAAAATLTIAIPGAAIPGGTTAHTATAAKVCHRGTPARINGATKCLQSGEYCSLSAERQYERYGYECSTRYRPPRLRRR
jgi:hypothetical protein